MQRVLGVCAVLLLGISGVASGQSLLDPGDPGSYTASSTTITTTNPNNGHALTTTIYYPSSGGQVASSGAPFAALVFAHGFLASPSYYGFFGDSSFYSGNGKHLASWGYIVAMPNFPSEIGEDRATDVQYLLSYLEAENANPASMFYGRIAVGQLGVVGHSLGGATILMVAARDSRIQAAVALDPGILPSALDAPWDYQHEAPMIKAPTAVLVSPCSGATGCDDMYPSVGSEHKANWMITNGSHCDFMDTDDILARSACYFLYGQQYSQERVWLGERYTTAWLNYYLRGQSQYFTYLYGEDAQADIQANRVTRAAQTAPQGVAALGQPGAILVRWDLPAYSVIAGYNIYRGLQSGAYPSAPIASVGRVSSYLDQDTSGGNRFYYVVRSRDADGNEHQPSSEVSAVPADLVTATATATATPTATSTSTPSSTPTATPSPTATQSEYLPKLWLPLLLVGQRS
jgi:pimeloyl-ACP methyl ester carboxylesterase